jgi:flagellar hook-length control protein FliK
MADGATALPNAATMAPAVDGAAMRVGLQAGVLTLTEASAVGAGAAAMPASATSSTDAFTALAALADRGRDTASASGDAGTSTTNTGFAPLLARGAEALQATVRTAPVAAPTALPLMLDADFDDGLGARVTWMAEQRIDHAQIRVSPESLGPIDVRLQLDGHRVNAQFHAANADVRQALESGMDRLRDMLGRQGMELGQAQVGSGARHGPDGRGSAPSNGTARGNGSEPATEAPGMRVALPRSRGLLDEYA